MDGPVTVHFDTNPDDCNLSCVMCERHSPYSELRKRREQGTLPRQRMDPALICAVFDELRGTRFREAVSCSRGEPLLYAHFGELADLCARDDVRLRITTNGTFPCGGARRWAPVLARIAVDIKVSVNGATPATQAAIMPGADLDEVKGNIRILVAARDAEVARGGPRARLTMKVTYMRTNVHELPELVRLAFELGFDRIRGMHLVGVFPEIEPLCLERSAETRKLFNRSITEARRVCESLKRASGRPFELSNSVPLDDGYDRGPCPYLGHDAWIDPDGEFAVCCVPPADRPVNGSIGNVSSRGILAVWNGPQYREFCRSYQEYPECAHCDKRRQVFETRGKGHREH